jgi:ribosome-binding factor A
MTSRRLQKAAQAIRQVVSMAILAEIKDPRVRNVTVTQVEVSPDMRQAKVFVSVMGDETQQRLSLHGLRSAAGYLQSKISERIDTRYTPRLEFVLDEGVKKSIAVAEILRRVLPPAAPPAADDGEEALHDAAEHEESEYEEATDELSTDGEEAEDEDAPRHATDGAERPPD